MKQRDAFRKLIQKAEEEEREEEEREEEINRKQSVFWPSGYSI
jgi:hypothetical protein